MSARARRAACGAIAAAGIAAACGWLAARDRSPRLTVAPHPARASERGAAASEPHAPYRARIDFPSGPDEGSAAPAAGHPRAPATPLPAQPPPPAQLIPVNASDLPPPAARPTMTRWSADYAQSVCACKSRSCVRDLQARFMRALGGIDFDRRRDEQAYVEAAHTAIGCYRALPEDS
jgi:hypothetical protein